MFFIRSIGICQGKRPMGRAEWARWGRGSCEGYSIHFGHGYGALGGQVVRNQPAPDDTVTRRASINARSLHESATREAAMTTVERELVIAPSSRCSQIGIFASWDAQTAQSDSCG